jgi:PDDEXK-like domain of unknown function (DUF3799)
VTLRETKWDGKPISEPGLFKDVAMASYHQQLTVTPSISSSGQRTIWSKSPAHFFDTSYLNPNRPDEPERPHFSIGRAAHHLLLLGRTGFDNEFVIRPERWDSWRTNDSQTWRAEQIKGGRTIITAGELEAIAGMAASLGRDPLVRAGILDGLVERTIVYRDPETGVFVKSRPDSVPADADAADLKSTAGIDDDSIQRSITEFGYHQQGATVRSAFRLALGVTLETFTLVFVEKTRPFCTRTVTLKPEDLDRGEAQNRVANDAFAHGVKTGEWPGPGAVDAEYMGLQPYMSQRIDKRLALEIPALDLARYEQRSTS